jgi:hypothetical protein
MCTMRCSADSESLFVLKILDLFNSRNLFLVKMKEKELLKIQPLPKVLREQAIRSKQLRNNMPEIRNRARKRSEPGLQKKETGW